MGTQFQFKVLFLQKMDLNFYQVSKNNFKMQNYIN